MKYINKKQTEPIEFSIWKAHPDNIVYGKLKGLPKKALKKSLIEEQGGLCCYCESRITLKNSHIEHFKPKSLYKENELDYFNLHASCIKTDDGKSEIHCGHKKLNDFSLTLVSPLESDCATHFNYTDDGQIHGSDKRGSEAIKMLNLSSELLRQKRQSLLDYFFELPEEDIDAELAAHLDETKPSLGEFFTMIKFQYKNSEK